MNYETAKKLKDAGFKQHGKNEDGYQSFNDESIYIPTLEELIEACGYGVGIFKISETETNAWKKDWPSPNPDEVPASITGSTPLEAVANLYLKLHEK